MTIHLLKTVNPHFQNVWDGGKTFEIRLNDRNFQVGDTLHLIEYFPDASSYVPRCLKVLVTNILTHEDFPQGLKEGYVCMSIKVQDAIVAYQKIEE